MTIPARILRPTVAFLIAACSAAPSATQADADAGTRAKPAAPAKAAPAASSGPKAAADAKSGTTAAPAASTKAAASTKSETSATKSAAAAPAPQKPPASAKPKSAAASDKAASATRKASATPEPSEHAATALAADPPAPEPVAPVTRPAPTTSSSGTVRVPTTDHVRVDVPPGLQAWLDGDDRMRPWLSKAITAVDACYAEVRSSDPGAAGTITFSVTMHRTARPSADVQSIPGPLRSMVMCATRRLFSVKMPLFTGTEGERYTVQAHFQP